MATAAHAGPPFLTDDPEPTETGHWEIYAPLFEAEGSGNDIKGSFGAGINYGPVKDVPLTLGLPMAYTHDASRWTSGTGDLAASVKYGFYHDEEAGVQIAAFVQQSRRSTFSIGGEIDVRFREHLLCPRMAEMLSAAAASEPEAATSATDELSIALFQK